MYFPNHFVWLLVFASYSSNKISNSTMTVIDLRYALAHKA